ncbi:MAG: D-alanine--D-alanine ligase family protein [Solirubrobacteraceae bacterium]
MTASDRARTPAATSSAAAGSLTVAVLAGGRSSEHDVSLSSAAAVRDGLVAGGHEVVWVEIGRDGAWRRDGEGEALRTTPGDGLLGTDVVFPVLHGRFGEDGTVQGMLETLDVPYVGSGVASSALCMDKVLFKELMAASGTIPQVGYVDVREQRLSGSADQELLEQVMQLGLPVFVKPSHLGSSVGIVKVTNESELTAAIESAFAYDERVIVEAAASGVEVECGVLGSLAAQRAQGAEPAVASTPGEIVFEGDFYDFDAKYAPGGMELLVPARISAGAAKRVRELALEAFARAGCDGLARVDFFVDGEHVLVNELNTMPGFTPTSVYAKLLAASGVEYTELVDRLCRLGIERFASHAAHAF